MMSSTTTTAVSTQSPASSPPATSTTVLVKLELIEAMTTNVDAVQERVLAEILGRNADSEYLFKKCDLAGATDRATFRAKVPMVTYEDLKPYIMRVTNGDRSPILSGSAHPISEFFSSSGTSGGRLKLIPSVEDELDRRQLLYSLIMPVMSQFMPGVDEGKGLYFLFVRPEMKTAGGLLARSVLTSYYKSDHFKNNHGYTSPMAAILCEDTFQSMYAQMVCGLCQRHDVRRVGAVFASGLLCAILFLQQHWEQLAADVEAGELSAACVSDPPVREAVAAAGILQAPDHQLALAIRAECSKGEWAGIVTRIWPNAKYLDTIVTGSMAQYVQTLNYYSGDLPIASTKYVSSECPIGLNLHPMCDPSEVSYTIMPNMAYFEFLPVHDADAAAGDDDDTRTACELVELAGVEVGREYELVVTTYGGLSRYRVGDVLRLTGFHNAAPRFRFACRKKVLLSIDADKTDEAELQRAVDRASALLRPHGATVLDYTSRTCAKSIPGHYVVYWELLLVTKGMDDVLPRCCLEMEEALSYVYRVLRVKDGTIGPLEIRVVRPGTFLDLADYSVAHGGASMGQYKVPRSVNVPAIVQLLDARVVSRHFSPALPHWEPVHHFESDRENA